MTVRTDFPSSFCERIEQIVPAGERDDFFQYSTEPLPRTIRLSFSQEKKALPSDWTLKPAEFLDRVYFIDRPEASRKTSPLGKTLEHFSGKMYIASLSSLLAAQVLGVETGEKVLDLCAAPGSKTTFLAEKVGPEGGVIANELSATRIKKLASNIDRMGMANTVICHNDGTSMYHFLDQEFDKILLDAPCSSEGFGRKSSDFFATQWSEKKIYECAKLQKKLIISAFNMLRLDGEMLYSTCTGAPEENEAVVQFLKDTYPDQVEILPIDLGNIPHTPGLSEFSTHKFDDEVSKNVRRLFPHMRSESWDSESFFLAKIRKKSPLKRSSALKTFSDQDLKRLSKNQTAEIVTKIFKRFGIPKSLFSSYVFLEKKGDIFLSSASAYSFAKKNKYQRVGLKIFDKHENPTNEFAFHFGVHAKKHIISLSEEQKKRYLSGYDLSFDEPVSPENQKGFCANVFFLRFDSFCLGWGKHIKPTKIKNKLDRHYVMDT